MTKSRVVEKFKRSTAHLCDWLVNEHPDLAFQERIDLALIIEDLAAQTRKREPSTAFIERFGGRVRRGRVATATDDELLLVRDVIRMLETQADVSDPAKEYLLGAHAKRLGYASSKDLQQAIDRAESFERK